MNDAEFQKKKKLIEKKGLAKQQRRELKELKKNFKAPRKKISTSKLLTVFLMVFLFLNCIAIEAFAMWLMVFLQDGSALYVLIGAGCTTVLGEVAALIGYLVKSRYENTAGGIVYDTTMAQMPDRSSNVEV